MIICIDFKTIFDGIGTQAIFFILSLIASGGLFFYYKKGKISQCQKAGNNSTQKQEVKDSSEKEIKQSQEAGDDSKQTQIG